MEEYEFKHKLIEELQKINQNLEGIYKQIKKVNYDEKEKRTKENQIKKKIKRFGGSSES